MIFWHFVTTFFYTFGPIGLIKTFFKSPGSWHEHRPIYDLHFEYIDLLSFIQNNGVLGVNIIFVASFWQFFFAILAIKMAYFLKLEHFLRPSLKTRSHAGSAHTFGSSHRLLEVPQKWV